MIETFYGSMSLNSPMAFVCSLVIGVGFGWCLEQAGFGSSKKLAGIFYFADMTVLKVMFSAVITAMLGVGFVLATGIVNAESIYVPETFLYAQVVGGLIFGIGFVIGGWCPGTAAVGMVSGRFDALVFLVGAMIGSFLFNDFFDILEPLYTMEDMGRSFIYELAGMTFAQFGLLLTVIAVIAFWFSELIEEKFKFTLVASRSNGLWVFSVIILLSACGNLLLDKFPIDSVRFAAPSSEEILLKVETGLDHIEPEIFAREKLAGQKKIALIDVRTREEFDEWHIPGAAHQPLSSLVAGLERYRRFDRIVLYSNGATHPGQAWAVLNAAGFKNVYILADGLQGFYERVLKPVSLRPEFISDRGRAEINTWRAMFLGSGMAAGAATPVSSGALTGP